MVWGMGRMTREGLLYQEYISRGRGMRYSLMRGSEPVILKPGTWGEKHFCD